MTAMASGDGHLAWKGVPTSILVAGLAVAITGGLRGLSAATESLMRRRELVCARSDGIRTPASAARMATCEEL